MMDDSYVNSLMSQPVMQAAAGEPVMQAAAGGPDGIGILGQEQPLVPPGPGPGARAIRMGYGLLSFAGMAVGAYHGYKRNRGSIGWTIGWALFGSALPIIALPVAYAQGIGKEKRG
jgi:hypothetical protein